MPEVQPTASAVLRSPDELRERRAAVAVERRRELRRRLRTGAAALLGAMTLAAGAAVAQEGTGGAGSEAQAAEPPAEQVLESGDSGRDVRKLQRRLRVRPVDGEYGPKTRRAVRRFQRRRAIPVDGIAGPATLQALGVTVSAASTGGGSGRVPAVLRRIAECESGGNPKAVSPDGRYRGKYQFLRSTWQAQGGSGDPVDASEADQDRIAIKLYEAEGTKPWPSCGASAA